MNTNSQEVNSEFAELVNEAISSGVYHTECVLCAIAEEVTFQMTKQDIDSRELASRIARPINFVKRVCWGDEDLRASQLAKIAQALNCKVKIYFEREESD